MILYHYSVDSYKNGEKLINDYSNHYQFAEPYILALRQGRAVFDSVYYATMYMSREIRDLKLRKFENFRKDAVEGIFEFIRETEFPQGSVSRIRCVYYCETLEEAVQYAMDDCISSGDFTKEQVVVLAVDVEENSVYRYDQTFYNMAMEAIEKNNIEEVIALARRYYSCSRTENPLIEIVSDGENHVIHQVEY